MTHGRPLLLCGAVATSIALCAFVPQLWAATPDLAPSLIPDGDPVALPGVGRVLVAFVLTAAIGVAAVYALRRWLPTFGSKLSGYTPLAADLRIIGRANIHSGLRLHVVEVTGRTVLVVEGKNGVAVTVLRENESTEAKSVP